MYQVHKDSSVSIKWYSESLTYKNGVNIYFSTDPDNWQKLNDAPIRKGDYYPNQNVLKQDSTLESMVSFMSGTTPPLDGIISLVS